MKEIWAVIRPERLRPVRDALAAAGFPGMRHHRVLGRGRQGGLKYLSKAAERAVVKYLPKELLSIVVAAEDLPIVVATIQKAAATGAIGDGKIFVLPVEEAYTVRTGARETFARDEVASARVSA